MIRRIVSTAVVLLVLLSLRSSQEARARNMRSWYYFGNRAQTALPFAKLSFDFQTRNAKNFAVDIFAIDRATYDRIDSDDREEPDFRTPSLRHATSAVKVPGEPGNFATTHLELAGLPIGLYAVRVNAGGLQSIDSLDVTTFSLVNAQAASGSVQYAVDLRTFHKRTDVTIGGGRVNADGLMMLPPGKADVTATADDGSVAFGTTYAFGDPSTPRLEFLQPDRPLYRPGDIVSYRIITRTGAIGSYAVPVGSTQVTLLDPAGKKLFDDTATYDAYGTLHGTFQLSDDTQLGNYNVSEGGVFAGSFAVEAYEKPEYIVDVTAPKSGDVIAGDVAKFSVDSKYFFGKPAAGLHLHFHAHAGPGQRWWFVRSLDLPLADRMEPAQPGEIDVSGDLATDASGRAIISIPTQPTPPDADPNDDRTLEIDVDGRDASGKTVTAYGSVPLSRASLRLGIAFDRWFATNGDDVTFAVSSKDFSDIARPHVPVTVSFEQYDYSQSGNLPSVSADLHGTTGIDGVAHFTWHADREGYLRVTARATDERGHATSSVSYIWISSSSYGSSYAFRSTSVSAAKSSYAPGETAHLLVTSPRADVDALVTVASGNTDHSYVEHLGSVATTIDVTAPSDAGSFSVSVSAPGPDGVSQGVATMAIDPAAHHLSIRVSPGKAKYSPGDTARFTLDVRDEHDRPVRAEIGVGVVDDALLALADPTTADPFDTFYRATTRQRYVYPAWQLGTFSMYTDQPPVRTIGAIRARNAAGAFQPGQTNDVYTVAGQKDAAPSFDALRSDFRDTAYWAPSVVTDRNGHAVVSFRWPDNLTSYTTAGIAVTQSSSVGSGTGKALVTKDYLVRLSTPRFMRRHDTARFVVSANGPHGATTTRLRFAAPGFGLPDHTVSATFDRYASATSTFAASSGKLGPSLLRLAGTSGNRSDGLQRSLDVESVGVESHLRYAGALPSRNSVALDLPNGAERGNVRVDLSPSIVARLYQNTHLLDVYPYYCVEQTMSAALPLIEVERLSKRTGLAFPKDSHPDVIAGHAIARLETLQHHDGSWGWWEHDAANPFMTAYALYGLTELSRNGHSVPGDMLRRGIDSLKAQLGGNEDTLASDGGKQAESLWNTRAFMLFALADASKDNVDRKALALADDHAAEMNPYALSALGLAHVELGDRAGAEPLLNRLRGQARENGDLTHWSGGGWHYRWEDDPIETTAYALRFLHAMAPNDPEVERTISWLMTEARGSWWYTTKDTAAALYALTDTLEPDRSEFSPSESVDVYLGTRLVKTVQIDTPIVEADAASFEIPASEIPDGARLRFVRRGSGSLYWSVDATAYVNDTHEASDIDTESARELEADTSDNFVVTRTYTSTESPWRVGDEVDVTLTVTAKNNAEYVAIEDQLPAGLEYQPRLHEASDNWSGLQFFDDRVLFFDSYFYSGHPTKFTYKLRATTAGTFTAPAPFAYAMYGPPVEGIGNVEHLTIEP